VKQSPKTTRIPSGTQLLRWGRAHCDYAAQRGAAMS
jgi:hypothetical protein